jgi:hypothetical protein
MPRTKQTARKYNNKKISQNTKNKPIVQMKKQHRFKPGTVALR